MTENHPTEFVCPDCGSDYKVVRVKADAGLPHRLIHCLAPLTFVALCACQGAFAPIPPPSAEPHPDVGTRRWFTKSRATLLCPNAPAATDLSLERYKQCRPVTTGSAIVEGVEMLPERGGLKSTVYALKISDNRSGYVSSLDFVFMETDEAHRRKLAEAADCDRRGGVSIGMTAKQVEASCWGKPQRINATIVSSGRREQWVYPGYNYVYLQDGVVTTIQTSER